MRDACADEPLDRPTPAAATMTSFAHYWGIDEVAVFVVPVVLAILGLRWAEKRARAKAERREEPKPEKADVD